MLNCGDLVVEEHGEPARRAYFVALEAAGRKDGTPLMSIWKERLERAE